MRDGGRCVFKIIECDSKRFTVAAADVLETDETVSNVHCIRRSGDSGVTQLHFSLCVRILWLCCGGLCCTAATLCSTSSNKRT
jgi:hypothetical protein